MKKRCRVGHVFAAQQAMGGKRVRTIGLERARVEVALTNIVYNLKRWCCLEAAALRVATFPRRYRLTGVCRQFDQPLQLQQVGSILLHHGDLRELLINHALDQRLAWPSLEDVFL